MFSRIARGSLFVLVLFAIVAGSAGRASAHHDTARLGDLVFSLADDVVFTWDNLFAGAGLRLDRLTVTTYTGEHRTACGAVTVDDIAVYCGSENEAYFNLDQIAEIAADYGEVGVALVVADTIGYHLLDAAGIRSSGSDRAVQASCLAGFWAWVAQRAGALSRADVASAIDFYWTTYEDGDLYADAFTIGYKADIANECFALTVRW